MIESFLKKIRRRIRPNGAKKQNSSVSFYYSVVKVRINFFKMPFKFNNVESPSGVGL